MSGRKGASANRPTTALVLSQSQSEEPSPAPRAWARGAKKRAAPTSMEDVRLAFDAELVKLLKAIEKRADVTPLAHAYDELQTGLDEDAAEIERLYKNVKLTSKTFAAELEEDKEASERFLATLSAPKTKEDATLAAAQKALSATHAQLVKLKHKFCGAS